MLRRSYQLHFNEISSRSKTWRVFQWFSFRYRRVCVCQCSVSNSSFWFIQNLVYFRRLTKVIITGFFPREQDRVRLLFTVFATCTEIDTYVCDEVVFLHATSWLPMHVLLLLILYPPPDTVLFNTIVTLRMRNPSLWDIRIDILYITCNKILPPATGTFLACTLKKMRGFNPKEQHMVGVFSRVLFVTLLIFIRMRFDNRRLCDMLRKRMLDAVSCS